MEDKSQNFKRRAVLFGLTLASGVAATGATAETKCAGERFEIKKSGNQWYWTLYASNGKKIADTEGYSSVTECKSAINRVKSAAQNADVTLLEDCK